MSNSIKRTSEFESYKTTAPWLKDFVEKIARQDTPISTVFSKTEKFATIEDKMIDIKTRVGFHMLEKITKESNEQIVTASKKCKCGADECSCSCKKGVPTSERIDSLKSILKYIKDMIREEPYLLVPEIISRCIDNSDLGFESTKIKINKLKEFIDNEKSQLPTGSVEIRYFKPGTANNGSAIEDTADYYQHGMPAPR